MEFTAVDVPIMAATVAQHSHGRKFTSTFYGVSWHKSSNRWAVQIRHESKRIHVGYYATEEEAAHAYDQVAVKLRGPHTRTNFDDRGNRLAPTTLATRYSHDLDTRGIEAQFGGAPMMGDAHGGYDDGTGLGIGLGMGGEYGEDAAAAAAGGGGGVGGGLMMAGLGMPPPLGGLRPGGVAAAGDEEDDGGDGAASVPAARKRARAPISAAASAATSAAGGFTTPMGGYHGQHQQQQQQPSAKRRPGAFNPADTRANLRALAQVAPLPRRPPPSVGPDGLPRLPLFRAAVWEWETPEGQLVPHPGAPEGLSRDVYFTSFRIAEAFGLDALEAPARAALETAERAAAAAHEERERQQLEQQRQQQQQQHEAAQRQGQDGGPGQEGVSHELAVPAPSESGVASSAHTTDAAAAGAQPLVSGVT